MPGSMGRSGHRLFITRNHGKTERSSLNELLPTSKSDLLLVETHVRCHEALQDGQHLLLLHQLALQHLRKALHDSRGVLEGVAVGGSQDVLESAEIMILRAGPR